MNRIYKDDIEPLLDDLRTRNDPRGIRMRKLVALPDLTRKENSPVRLVAEAALRCPILEGSTVVEIPEIVTVASSFDLLNAPADHPSRSEGDTFYVDADHVLRPHTTAFWSYYLRDPEVRRSLEQGSAVKAVCYGKVYRRDEIDRNHYPVFHQMDGLYLCDRRSEVIGMDNLWAVATGIARSIYGPDTVCRRSDDSFPFTTPSMQLEVRWGDGWLELMGAGLVHPEVLMKLDLDPEVYNGWAFGFGLDRLAMVKMSIPDIRILWLDDPRITRQFESIDSTYHEVSRFPATSRDVSMLVDGQTSVNQLYEAMREVGNPEGEELIEEVRLTDRYTNGKFGDRVSLTFRVVYRSNTRTLTNGEVNAIQEKLRTAMVAEFGAELR